nr:hypothetical protein L204_05405 [Cryptococcus depauperatus CBS 7855]
MSSEGRNSEPRIIAAEPSAFPSLRALSCDRKSIGSVESEESMGGRPEKERSFSLSPSQSSKPGSPHERIGSNQPNSPTFGRLPLIYRSPPPLPGYVCNSDKRASNSRSVSPLANSSGHGQRLSYRSSRSPREPPPRYPREHSHRNNPSLPPIHTHPREYHAPLISPDYFYPLRPLPHHYHDYYASVPYPSHVHARAKDPAYRMPAQRPRLLVHPYAAPPVPVDERIKYYSAGALPHGPARDSRWTKEKASSPGSAASSLGPQNLKSPRKRADDVQLAVLSEVFQRTSYPTTEEREELAKQLGMTSRSVQIWFQNRRRAVKVDQQSAIQRAQAEARVTKARSRRLTGPPYAEDEGMAEERGRSRGRSLEWRMPIKRERVSPEERSSPSI